MTLLTRWEPLREFSTMQDRMSLMNRFVRESYSPEGPEEALTTTNFAPPVDIYEDEHTISLKMEVQASTNKTLMSHREQHSHRPWRAQVRNGRERGELPSSRAPV